MEAKDKAHELLQSITDALLENGAGITKQSVKACALILCDSHIAEWKQMNDDDDTESIWSVERHDYWQSVKQEITKL